jgi:uncharacterized delta-60 repeat protein
VQPLTQKRTCRALDRIVRFSVACFPWPVAQIAAADFAPNPNGPVTALALQSDGKLIVGGEFNSIDRQSRTKIARLQPSGALDPTFNAGAAFSSSDVIQLVVQPDGKILARSKTNLSRLNPDGSRDTAFIFRPAFTETTMMQLQPDGKILISGSDSYEPYFSVHLRLYEDGAEQLDLRGILGRAFAAAVRPDGMILLAGSSFAFLPNDTVWKRQGIARLLATATFDPTFDAKLNGPLDSLALQRDGQILVVGDFTSVHGQPRDHVARLNPDGSLDPTFMPGLMTFLDLEGARRNAGYGGKPIGLFTKVAELPGGGIALSGTFTSIGGRSRAGLARLMPTGAVDESFNPPITGSVADMAIRPNGNIIVGGSFALASTPGVTNLAEIESGGTPLIVTAPASRAAVAGSTVTLVATATGSQLRYQWRLNGADIADATAETYTIPSVQAFHAGRYTVSVSNSAGAITSTAATVTVNKPPPSNAKLTNVSNRGYCAADDRVLITGFTVSLEGPKTLLIRAVGPTLESAFGLSGALSDPQLAVFGNAGGGRDTLLFSNDDWESNRDAATTASVAAQVGAFALPRASKDAALVATLPPGAYTVVANGVGGASGFVLVEIFDAP